MRPHVSAAPRAALQGAGVKCQGCETHQRLRAVNNPLLVAVAKDLAPIALHADDGDPILVRLLEGFD